VVLWRSQGEGAWLRRALPSPPSLERLRCDFRTAGPLAQPVPSIAQPSLPATVPSDGCTVPQVDFPERPGALRGFLRGLDPRWNISLFHYRRTGGRCWVVVGYGCVRLTMCF
jgi:hypothetical protein